MIGLLRRSLKTRVTLFTLVIFALSLWGLAYYAYKMLQADMAQLLGDQQRSTVAMVAANIDQELKDRVTALEGIASNFDEEELQSPTRLQGILERRPILPLLFNGGYFVTDAAGIAIASIPVSVGRIGINYSRFDNVAAALGEGKSVIGALEIGVVLRVPVFSIAVPIQDAQGKVLGSLVGVVNLSLDNFLDRITSNSYGQTGSYVLVARQQRMIVTATDKSRALEILPPPGASPAIDSFLAGREGSLIFRNPIGVEVLASAKNIPVAGWYVAATLPTAEAFAPINRIKLRMLQATILLTFIIGVLTWWMLRHQLTPLAAAAATLAARPRHGLIAEPLPVTTQDEIGQLISSFNSLLDALRRIVKDLGETQRIAHIGSWHLDVASNQVVWTEELYNMYGFDPSLPVPSYTDHMRLFTPESWERLSTALAHTREIGVPYTLELETVRKDGSNGWMWVQGEVEVDSAGNTVGLWGAAQDITERKRAEADIRLAEARFRAIIEASPIPFALNDSALNITYLNSAFTQTFGYDLADIPTLEAWWPKAYPDERYRQEVTKEWLLRLEAAKRDAKPFEPTEVRIRCKDGSERTVLATATPLVSSFEDLHVVVLYDITERKQAEEAVLEALARVDRLAQHVPGMLYQYHLRLDGSSYFPYASNGIKEIYGVLPEQVSHDAQVVFKVIHPEDLQRVSESIQSSACTLSDWHEQYRLNLPDGRTIWVEGEASPEAAPDGGVLWHGHIRDITERKKTELQLHEQLDELRRWQQAMLGRESRIISMKQEVNELLARLGQLPRYASQLSAEPGEGEV
ncbi:MAG: PAS domain S-box protein [Methylobacter sp.]|nr:PAS domain S-box protein [Methylobacter sp.]MDP2099548.1 PAS domain S-box protein [Methylobacter sp.]MDP3053559.1 PAS domain S-box protein [Methylobacter sp.]MDP3362752.1 PAS domain S-box protein [Methylobacter sp.]MDZ4220078.1 PAS domain S-box protein [Methylobacter sp.]